MVTAHRGGGVVQLARSGAPIHDMQRALTAVGTYTAEVDGSFGSGTQLALRLVPRWLAAPAARSADSAAVLRGNMPALLLMEPASGGKA